MTNFVLVPGMWLGGWAWQDVAEPLRAAGHRVYPVTLTGLGERVHLGGPQVNLDTHRADVVNLLYYEDLHDVVLAGHSFGGTVVTAAADEAPERIARLIYVDTWPLPAGIAQMDMLPPADRAAQEQIIANQGEGWRVPLPPWGDLEQANELAGLGPDERSRMRERAAPHPFGAVNQPAHYPHGAWERLPKTAIWCSVTTAEVEQRKAAFPQFSSTLNVPNWQAVELPTGHWPMFSRPRDLATLLIQLAG